MVHATHSGIVVLLIVAIVVLFNETAPRSLVRRMKNQCHDGKTFVVLVENAVPKEWRSFWKSLLIFRHL